MKLTTLVLMIAFTLTFLGCTSEEPPDDLGAAKTEVTAKKVGCADNETFDTVLETLLVSKEQAIVVLTDVEFDGVNIPDLGLRLQAWLQLWLDANRNKGGFEISGEAPPVLLKSSATIIGINLIKLVVDLTGFDPDKTVGILVKTAESWAKEGARAVKEYVTTWNTKRNRKNALANYYLYFTAVDGKAALILSTDKLTPDEQSADIKSP